MLLNIHIKNMALIDEIDIDFHENLNILTGETGAGKSIVIDSIMLALGGKTPKDFVRQDAPYGLVELLFSVADKDTLTKLEAYDITDIEDGELILSRKIMGSRSVCKVNGQTVTMSVLREIAALLLDLHAQHEHQSLLNPSNHMMLLDRYGQQSLQELKDIVAVQYQEYRELEKYIEEHSMNEEEQKRQLDLISFELDEIKGANLKSNEDENLEAEYKMAANSKNIAEALGKAHQYIEQSTGDGVDRAIRELQMISDFDGELSSMEKSLETVSDVLSDFCRSARVYLEDHTYSEEDFRQLEERLNTMNHLKAKYGKTIEDVLAYADELEVQYDEIAHQEERLADAKKKLSKAEALLIKSCEELSQKRMLVGKELAASIKEALVDLNFLDVRFDIQSEPMERYTANGFDHMYFIISTNVGEEMKPLWQVASGGELARIMLAIKSCLAEVDGIETLIFDEIDVGISGRTAQMVAQKIHKIGNSHQVICITHLPQIAAMANHHYLIQKGVVDGKTITQIHYLNKEEEIDELARLIGGVEITETVLNSAREMKELATLTKLN